MADINKCIAKYKKRFYVANDTLLRVALIECFECDIYIHSTS
jgi:hypothetical protein